LHWDAAILLLVLGRDFGEVVEVVVHKCQTGNTRSVGQKFIWSERPESTHLTQLICIETPLETLPFTQSMLKDVSCLDMPLHPKRGKNMVHWLKTCRMAACLDKRLTYIQRDCMLTDRSQDVRETPSSDPRLL
jgi:hypothetical protein